ncbi:hypothetical protein A2U01_0040748, partial [Trifolium medium]|nr:hypothetical protein [Trifolium medium]
HFMRRNTEQASQQQQQQQAHRIRPPINWYKCNIDVGFHNEIGKTNTGWCLRDSRRQFVIAGTS